MAQEVEAARKAQARQEIALIFHGQQILPPTFSHYHGDYAHFNFTDQTGRPWMLRILRGQVEASDSTSMFFASHVLEYIKRQRPWLKVPAVLFILPESSALEQIRGQCLTRWNVGIGKRCHLLDDLAKFYFGLWSCPHPCLPERPWTEYILQRIDTELESCLMGSNLIVAKSLLLRRHMIPTFAPENLPPGALTRLVVDRGNNRPENIIIDERNYGLVGVVDWDLAQWVPALSAIRYPAFLSGLVGNYETRLTGSWEAGRQDREYFQEVIERLANEHGQAWIAAVLAFSQERFLFERSLFDFPVECVFMDAVISQEAVRTIDIRLELDRFLAGERALSLNLQGLASVVQIRDELSRAELQGESPFGPGPRPDNLGEYNEWWVDVVPRIGRRRRRGAWVQTFTTVDW